VTDCRLGEVEIPRNLAGRLEAGEHELDRLGLVLVREPAPLPPADLPLCLSHGGHRKRLSLGVNGTGSSPGVLGGAGTAALIEEDAQG
jgi:hypothetical protein